MEGISVTLLILQVILYSLSPLFFSTPFVSYICEQRSQLSRGGVGLRGQTAKSPGRDRMAICSASRAAKAQDGSPYRVKVVCSRQRKMKDCRGRQRAAKDDTSDVS